MAAAVTRGVMPSGRVHFDAFGSAEQRALRRRVPDAMKAEKLARVRPLLRDGAIVADRDMLIDCLPDATRAELHLDPTDNVSAHEYDERALALIDQHRDGLVLDCGAGLRNTYYPNVVNYEIVAYDTTDVLGAAERLPFADATFEAVLSLNVLEHVKDPFEAAREIMRVMKPGAELMAVAPFLQPLHGYPHHYYNMTARGLENLFEPLVEKSIAVYGAMRPVWALNWFLQRYAASLEPMQRSAFESMTVADLMCDASALERETFATDMAPAALTELASAHALFACKPAT
ncbi:methyltransferase domain-containing protein [Lysobacter humi (ex Lee et al. 2017)]